MKCGMTSIIILIMINLPSRAEVTFDGTLGPRLELEGPIYHITSQLGQQQGDNLFHSFDRFSLVQGEQALFSGPPTLKNVISRVTGGATSHIDGIISSAIPQADVYFINPAGILFGPHAQLNVPASFYVSTANYLQLGSEGRFDASTPENTLLTVAPPSAFGFLDNHPAPLTLVGSQLSLPNSQAVQAILQGKVTPTHTLGLIGGDITFNQAQVRSYGHDIHLISVAAPGTVPLDPNQLTEDSFTDYGTLQVTDNTSTANRLFGHIDASGLGGGAVFIRAGQIVLDQGWIFADTWRDQDGRGIIIQTDHALTMQNGSRITTEVFDTYFPGQATGAGGSIAISAGDIQLNNGSQIASSTRSLGSAGPITVTTLGTISITDMDRNGPQSLSSAILSDTFGQGAGGHVTLAAKKIMLDNEAQINISNQGGSGPAGQLSVQVDSLEIQGGAQINSGVGSQNNPKGTGTGGRLTINAAKEVLISGRSVKQQPSGLFSNVFSSQGQGGTIKISTPKMTLTKGGSIQTVTLVNGQAGRIALQVDTLDLNEGGMIQSSTIGGSGPAGNIEILARNAIQIKGAQTGISAAAQEQSVGQGGQINLTTDYLYLREGGAITVSSLGQGHAGQINLNLNNSLFMENSSIRTATTRADGGHITLTTPSYLQLINSEISTSVNAESGDGGNMILKPEFIVLDNSRIKANAFEGRGGNIDITTTAIYNFSGEPLSQVITASSQLGIDGEITIRSPEDEAAEDILILPSSFIDAAALLNPNCQIQDVSELSTFSYRTQREGMPITPNSFQE